MTSAFLHNTTTFTVALLGTVLLGGTAPASGATITYSDPACESFALEGSNGNFTLRCVAPGSGGAPGAPTGCVPQITATPSPLTNAGGTVNLDVGSCSPSTGTGLTYSWSRNGSAGWKTEKSPSDSLVANTGTIGATTSYQVKVCDGTACTGLLPAVPLTATVPGSGGVGAISCAAQGFTKTMSYSWDWASGGKFVQTYNDSQGPLGNNGIVVIAFRPTAAGSTIGSISISEYPANSTQPLGTTRTSAISEQPCDLSGTTVQYGTRVGYNVGNGFVVDPTSQRGVAKLTVGKQYYLNIANRDSTGHGTCTGMCDVRIEANHP